MICEALRGADGVGTVTGVVGALPRDTGAAEESREEGGMEP